MLLLFSGISIAQQGINYKAFISDDGSIVQNQQIAMSFTILENGVTPIYKESHILSTDSNGLIITNIGEGNSALGNFANIDWAEEQFLKVEVDTGSGIVDMGTTAFKNVPYALHAETAETFTGTIPNIGNLLKVTENGVNGYRLVDEPANNHGDIGENAIDLSNQSYESDTSGATGESSFAVGDNTTASGLASVAMGQITSAADFGVAMGYGSKALDDYSTAIGYNNNAVGRYSTAFGGSNYAAADQSTTMGWGTRAESTAETAIGKYNSIYTPELKSGWSINDRLFVVGNGSSVGNRGTRWPQTRRPPPP